MEFVTRKIRIRNFEDLKGISPGEISKLQFLYSH